LLILGVDPGSRHTGYALIETGGGSMRLIDEGRVSLPPRMSLPQRLAGLIREMGSILERWQPQAVAVESPYHGPNVKSLIVLAQARGAILALMGGHDIEIHEYSPAEVKIAVAGNGRADKAQVSRMVHLLLSLDPSDRSDDQTDAMAVAVCYAKCYRMERVRHQHGVGKAL